MRRLLAIVAILSAACWAQSSAVGTATYTGIAIYNSGPGVIPSTLFGMHFSTTRNVGFGATGIPWPPMPFGSLRLWDTNTNWLVMNPSSGVYAFGNLDAYLLTAKTNGMTDVILTLSGTPAWASSDPTNISCDYGSNSGLSFLGNGSCGAPVDLNADGTGTDQDWRSFIYNLGTHVAGLSSATYATVNWFEMWNEFTRGGVSGSCGGSESPVSWEGTCAEMVRMSQDANCILTGRGTIAATSQTCTAGNMNVAAVGMMPLAHISTPNAYPAFPDIVTFDTYLSGAGALAAVDAIAVHAYVSQGLGTTGPEPIIGGGDSLPSLWSGMALPPASFGIPVWSTEGSWGPSSDLPDPDVQEGYVARYYLLGWSSGFRRMYWYSANNSYGRLVNQFGENGCASVSGCITKAGTGYGAIYSWMVGVEMTGGCTSDATGYLWQCGLVTGGHNELAVWDASKTCSGGVCTTSTFTIPVSGLGHYRTLDGGSTLFPVTGVYPTSTVAIGIKPVLLVP